MRPLEAPKLKVDKSKSETPNRHRKVPGMVKRLRRFGILGRVLELGKMSDGAVIEHGRSAGLLHDLAFRNHQQRFRGSLERLKKMNPFQLTIPVKVLQAIQASAMKSTQGERK